MPTKPLESIIYRELSIAEAQDLIGIASPLLKELVNFGSNALVRVATSTSGEENEDLAILFLYRHIIEMTDAIEVLLSQSCVTPAVPLLRSSFEALLSIEYIVEDEANYVKRSLSWLMEYANEKMLYYESLDPSTTRGRDAREALKADRYLAGTDIDSVIPSDLRKYIDNMRSLISRKQFEDIAIEYKLIKGKKAWYSLFGGPKNIRGLAQYVGRNAQYDFLYRNWSKVSHAHDFSTFILNTEVLGEGGIRPIRSIEEFRNIVGFTKTFFLYATQAILRKFRPEESLTAWYKREIMDLSKKIR